MSDLTSNTKSFNLPAYIQIPFFLYQDHRLDRSALLIAGFYYSIHTSGNNLIASTDYLCQLAKIKKRQLYMIMNQLEDYKYILRTGFTNRKKTQWIYDPKSTITIMENDTSALQCTNVQELNTSAVNRTKLVHSNALNYCTGVHIDNKEDIKDYKESGGHTPSAPTNSSLKPKPKTKKESAEQRALESPQIKEMFEAKFGGLDVTLEELFKACQEHNEQKSLWATKDKLAKWIQSERLDNYSKKQNEELVNRIPTKEDFDNYRKCVNGYDWVGVHLQKQK